MALVRIQVRRDTAANWDAANPVLAAGEIGSELDSGRLKVGDGIRNWRNLPYSSGATPATTPPLAVGPQDAGVSVEYARADHAHPLPASATFTALTTSELTVAGNLAVTGTLTGGTHTHSHTSITDWSTASSDAVFANLAAGSNVTLSRDSGTGVVTISAASGGAGAVSSVAGRTGEITLTTNDMANWPSPTGNAGKYLSTDGTTYIWDDPLENGGVSTVNSLTGDLVLTAGANVTLSANPSTGAITIAANTTAGTGDVTSVNSLVGGLTIAAAAGSGLSVAASGSTITLDASIAYDDLTGVPATFTPSSHTHAPVDVTGLAAEIETTVDSLLAAGTNITLTYDDVEHTITIDAAGADAPTLIAGDGIAIDTSVPGEAEISLDGTMDGGSYEGFELPPDPPYFSIQPESQTVTFGTAIFGARVENANSPTYQWERAASGSDTFTALSDGGIYSGVATTDLTVSPVDLSSNGDKFRLRVALADGSTLLSAVAVLSTSVLVVVDHPLGVIFEEAPTLETEPYLAVSAEGGTLPYSYQWQSYDGSSWSNVSGETDSSIASISGSLGSTEAERITPYRCRIEDDAGAVVYSDPADIVIQAVGAEIVTDPTDQTIVAGAATLTCDFKGKGSVASWERRLPNEQDFLAIGQAGVITTVSATVYRSTLSLTGLTGNDSGAEYRLRVSNINGQDVSSSATVATSAPVISSQPKDTTVVAAAGAAFTVVANFGGGALTYQWQEKTSGGSWASLSGETSSTLTLSSAGTPLGRDGSEFRCIVTGGGVDTTSDPALLTVISAPDAGDAVFSIDPSNATVIEGSAYSLTAVSTWLGTTDHYAIVRVEYDDGGVEYHPLSTGTSWLGTVTRKHLSLAHSEYKASLTLPKSAWVSVCASTSAPTVFGASGSTYTLQPFAYARIDTRDCSASPDTARPRTGVISHPVSQTIATACVGTTTLNVPDPPHTYVESKAARVTVAPRQAFIGPVPKTGFWNPPTSYVFDGACDPTGTHVVAVATNSQQFGSYLYSGDGGKTWMTRNLPFGMVAIKVLYAHGKFYIFGGSTAVYSDDDGLSFNATGWNFGGTPETASLAGSRLYAVVPRTHFPYPTTYYWDVWSKTLSGTWVKVASFRRPVLAAGLIPTLAETPVVSYAHGRWYFGKWWSSDGTSFAVGSSLVERATAFYPVTLADTTQNYVLSNNGHFAPVSAGVGTANFSAVTNGQDGGGPQAGDYVYFGTQTLGSGAEFFRKGSGNPGVNEKLYGHSTYWTGLQNGEWADIQVMSYVFGDVYGDDLDMTYYNVVSDPQVSGAIFLPDRILHLFRYRQSSASSSTGGSISSPTRR
jgi:hypothetical protein